MTRPITITSSVPRSVINKSIDHWHTRLRACVKAKGQRLEHLLYASADFRRNLTGYLQSHSDLRGRQHTESFIFLWLMFSQVV